MKTEEIFKYVQKQYGTVPEYLWSKSPDSAVLRHKNGKWYAVIMTVEKSKLGLEGKNPVDIMDVDRKSTRLNSSHASKSRMPSSA